MQFKTPLMVVVGIIAALCVYYLSFTFISRGIENDAVEYATDVKTGLVNSSKKNAYLDSMWTTPVSILGYQGFTYKDIKEQEVKLGLDLRGGMNVTMEVSAPDIILVLADNNNNPAFRKSLTEAQAIVSKDGGNYVDAFYKSWKANANGLKLASIFSTKANAQTISFNATDEVVLKYISKEVDETIDRSFEILRARIDKFGVTAPNIQRLQGTNRINIELPGVDDPNRVRKLLQGAAQLEFLEVYKDAEWGPFFNKLNDKLVAEEKTGSKSTADLLKDDSDTTKTASAVSDTTKKDTTASAALFADTAKKDTAKDKAAAKADTAKKKSTASSVLSKLFIPLPNGGLMAATRDTGKINRLFAREDVKKLFPSNLSLLYDAKPMALREDNKEAVMIYFIKRDRDGKAPLDGRVITNAYLDFDPTNGKPGIGMTMDATGTRLWRKMTGANVGRQVAIVLDNRVYSAPVVQNEIPNGNSNISGSFEIEEARDLANILKAGRMPVPTRIVEEVVVGPTLGKESITQGINSILIGFAIIILFMIAYYSNSGIVANIAVLLNVLLILGILVPLDAVLTLPGIAGIVLTIGMAVDANVLINERIKDELAAGVPLYTAVGNGYDLASSSIWDANITTLIGGFVMAFFGSGPVKGFAYTLVIGIFTSLVTSVYVTRVITEWRLSKGAKISFTTSFSKGLFKNINYDFVSKRKLAYVGSSIVITLGIVSLFVQGLDYGIDFKGGYTFIVASDKPINSDNLRDALTPELGNKAPEVKSFGSASRYKVTTTYLIEDNAADAADRVEAQIVAGLKNPKLAADNLKIESSSKVGPTIAQDIKTKSITAVLIAMLGIFAYIWLRFRKWEYALGSTIAVIHDTMIIITVFSVFKNLLPFNLEIDQNFIAAILTIIGYSVNDNVVIFDRIRESIKEDGGKSDTTTIVNKALNYTFSRTVITASTVFVVVLILLVFGGETIRGLSFALLIGVITGTYSTIYIAVPFLIDAGKKQLAKEASRA